MAGEGEINSTIPTSYGTEDNYRSVDINLVYEQSERVAKRIRQIAGDSFDPTIGIICGSGLSPLSEIIEKSCRIEIPFDIIPEFPKSKVDGHANSVILGKAGSACVICFQGRCHFYEGHPMWKVTLPVRVMKLLGVKILFVTNCCGGVNPDYRVGDIVIIKDHVSMPGISGFNPLVGENDNRWGTRFPHLFDGYDRSLRKLCASAVKELDISCHEGVFCMFCGPSYQTRAEGKMVHLIGGDVVGMSTAPEVVVANHCGIKVCTLSLIASRLDYYENINHDSDEVGTESFKNRNQNRNQTKNGNKKESVPKQQIIHHNDVVDIGKNGAVIMSKIIKKVISRLHSNPEIATF